MGDSVEGAEVVPEGQLLVLDQLARRVGRGQHQVRLDGRLVELGHGVTEEVRGDGSGDGVELVATHLVVVVARPVLVGERRRGQAVLVHQTGDGLQVLHPGLPAAQSKGDEAVGAGPDLPGHPDARPRPLPPHLRPGEPPGVTHGGDHHRLLGRDVHHLRPSRGQSGQRRHGRLGTDMGPRRRLRAAHRGPVGIARAVHVPRRGHHPEIARLPG